MKKIISILVVVLAFTLTGNAQDTMMKDNVKTVALEQTKGEFTQKSVTLSQGTYIFEVTNHAGIDVGFVLVSKGKDASNPENHIQTAYVTQIVKNGETQKTRTTKLSKGEYVYFCPLNKTPQYSLVVK